jgi:hypothetical protein
MKKIFTCSFLFAICFTFFTSCSKEVKAPVKNTYTAASTNTSAGTQISNQNQSGHTCGGSNLSDINDGNDNGF